MAGVSGLASGLGLAGLAAGLAYLLYASIKWASDFFRGDSKDGSNVDGSANKGTLKFRDVSKKFPSTVAAINKSSSGDVNVREAIEKFTESLIGDGLDQVQVTRISFHPSYEEFISRYEGPLSILLSRLTASLQLLAGDLATGAPGAPDKILGQLKQMIKHIIFEAEKLPHFQKVQLICNLDILASKSYEDILSIAILNKVVESQQQAGIQITNSFEEEAVDSSDDQSIHSSQDGWEDNWSESTDPLSMKDGLVDADENQNWAENESSADLATLNIFFDKRTAFPEFGVDIVHAKNGNPGYEKHLHVNSWEENWLFKKRKLKQSVSTSVSMLVPSPNEPAKVFIGDKDAEETSDLSDCSDSEIEDVINSKYDDKVPEVNLHTLPKRRKHLSDITEDSRSNNDKVSDNGTFEESILRSSISNVAYRCKDGSYHFRVNPLFIDDSCFTSNPEVEQHYTSLQFPKNKTKTRHIVLPPREELFSSSMSSLKDLRKSHPYN